VALKSLFFFTMSRLGVEKCVKWYQSVVTTLRPGIFNHDNNKHVLCFTMKGKGSHEERRQKNGANFS